MLNNRGLRESPCLTPLPTSVALLIQLNPCFYFVSDVYVIDGFYYVQWYLSVRRDNSVRIVSGYGLDDRAIEVRSLAEAKGFFL
jgi:hypothetical protein